jgi:hypothetical protein
MHYAQHWKRHGDVQPRYEENRFVSCDARHCSCASIHAHDMRIKAVHQKQGVSVLSTEKQGVSVLLARIAKALPLRFSDSGTN